MKKLIALALSMLLIMLSVRSQSITGRWYSKDGSRQFQISEQNDRWEALLVHSDRPGEEAGKLIVSLLSRKKNKYRGIIYSADGEMKTTVTIRVSPDNKRVLLLRLKRMLLMDVTIRWYRDPLL
ncbi:MAG: hypothetical protein J0M10_12880 [Chitinophagales bacterium]|nr:hypothetical protein [Chitinophagales bacterium]